MSYKQPHPKAHQLLGQLSQLSREDEKNEILMRRLRNEAESLVNQFGQATDYIALGAIDTVLNNPVRVKETFNQGLEKYPNDSQLQSNYAVSLDKLGFVSEAMDYAQRAYESHQGDLLLLNHLIGHCIQSGHLTAAKHWLEQWQRLQPNEPHGYLSFVEKARELLLKSKVSDEAVAALLQISYAVLHDNGIYYLPERELSIEQDECYLTWITYDIEIPRSIEESVDLGVELADRFAQTELGTKLNDKVLVHYTPGLKY
jgi:tetratricopeptide (TPR) repeat protein